VSEPIDAVITALKTITGMSNKVFHAQALKTATAPFIFWVQYEDDTEQALDGYTDLHSASYEIHIVAENVDALNTLSSAAKEKIIALQGGSFDRVDISMTSPLIDEREVNLYRKVYNIKINY